ncbi:MAG TPA: OpgC domain-containing protein [Opitutaceae bacterium]|nr:OpgC domain-containing protein [Opitutaceae bacterium]
MLPTSRDLRFDTLRGLFLVCMVVNHLPTEIRAVTDQSLGLFSAAEGFVFLSGLLAGWVYTRKYRTKGNDGLWAASTGRARSIYRWHIGSLLLAFVAVQATEHILGFCAPTVPRLFFEHPLLSLGLGASLLYQPGLLDLLPMYCGFVLLLPTVIKALEAGRHKLVLGLSAAVWLVIQFAPPIDGAPLYPINTGSFNLLAWQMLFVAGVTIGHARISGHEQLRKPNPVVLALCAAVAVYGIGVRQANWPSLWPDRLYGMLLNKPALGLLRLADFGSVAYLVGALGSRFPQALSWRPLAFLGRHSLAVVAMQSVAITILLQFPLFETPLSRTVTAVGLVGFLFAGAAIKERYFDVRPERTPVGARQGAPRGIVGPDDARAA